jgi:hypothetical protein
MNTTNKPNSNAVATPDTAKATNKPSTATQPELKKPTLEVNKPEVPEKAAINNDKALMVPVKESTEPNQLIPTVTKPEPAKSESAKPEKSKNPTKAEKAKAIYDEMVKDPKNDRSAIIAKIKKELLLTKAGAQTYFYKFQRESGHVTEKLPSKMEKAKVVYEKMTLDGKGRKDIIAAFVKEVELTPAGASTYFQNLKKAAAKPTK